MTYFAKLTTAGAALLAAATSGSPVELQGMAIGDANGTPYNPTGAETGLVHQVATATLDSIIVDPDASNVLIATATFPAAAGGYTVREAILKTSTGVTFAIASVPAIYKPQASEGAGVDLILKLKLIFSGDANVTVGVSSSTAAATQTFVMERKDYYKLTDDNVGTPPGAPGLWASYLIPTGATGAWASRVGQIAVYGGSVLGWIYASPFQGMMCSTRQKTYRYETTGWSEMTASETHVGFIALATSAETIAGTEDTKAVTAAGLATLTSTAARRGLVELATNAETQTGTDTDRAVTPAALSSRTATETRTGLIELATDAEVQAGTDTARAVTPAGLATLTATETRRGLVELSNNTEGLTGTDTARAITPAVLKYVLDDLKADIHFMGMM